MKVGCAIVLMTGKYQWPGELGLCYGLLLVSYGRVAFDSKIKCIARVSWRECERLVFFMA